MTRISDPFVYFTCVGCKRNIAMKIFPRRAREQIEELRDGPELECAECYAGRVLTKSA
jgi:hypothetical protein